MTLQEKFPDIKLYTIHGILDEFGWEYEQHEDGIRNVRCCGENVFMGGFIGTEYVYCEKCGKGTQDITGFHILGNSYGGFPELDDVDGLDYELHRWYVAKRKSI